MSWWRLAARGDVAFRALKLALVVGPLLILINHWDALLSGTVTFDALLKMLLTMVVPYCVSTWSSVATLRRVVR